MVKRIVAIIICVCAAIACLGSYISYRNSVAESESLARQLADVENQIAAKEARNSEIRTEVLAGIGGIDERRLNEDAKLVDEIFSVAFTWSSYEEYNNMRETLVSEYGFDEDGQFLTDVFGYIGVSDVDPDYNYIDAHELAIEYSSSNLYCIGVSTMQYHYFGEIKWRVLSVHSGGSVSMTYGFTLTTNEDGTIADLFVMDVSD